MASPAKLSRDNTMETTAKEGIKYLEKSRPDLAEQVKTVTKETSENGSGDAVKTTKNGDSPSKLIRDNTMEATAKEGIAFLRQQGAHEVIKQHGLDKLSPRSKQAQTKTGKSALVRDNTMVITAKEGKEYLEKHGGVNADAKTRAEEAELDKSTEQVEEKATTKRAAEDEPEADVDEAKKQKTEEDRPNGSEEQEEKDGE